MQSNSIFYDDCISFTNLFQRLVTAKKSTHPLPNNVGGHSGRHVLIIWLISFYFNNVEIIKKHFTKYTIEYFVGEKKMYDDWIQNNTQ